jgi:DNA-binding beta-propeller fold protein YncE
MKVFSHLRLLGALLLALLLSACASDTIRGRLTYDLRPAAERKDVFWPAPPDTPRYRYLGQLVGQPNFDDSNEKSKATLVAVFKWIVGLFEMDNSVFLQRPQHGAVSDNGRIYVVDAGRNAVIVFDPNGPPEDNKKKEEKNKNKADEANKTEDRGQMLSWEFATPTNRFAGPVAVAGIGNDEIAVSDAKLGIVVRLDATGTPVGNFGAGQLKRPAGLAFDPERGWLFVADTVAHDIKVFDRDGKLVNTFGSNGNAPGQFNAPTHLAFWHGKLYVTDTLNSRIQVFDAEGRILGGLGERGINVGNLPRPKGVALDPAGVVYVVESYFGYLLAYNQQNDLLLGITGTGLDDDKFLLPSGVWTDKQGRIFVADMFNGRIVMFQFVGPPDDA